MSDPKTMSIDQLKRRRDELMFVATEYAGSGAEVPAEVSSEFERIDRELDRRLATSAPAPRPR